MPSYPYAHGSIAGVSLTISGDDIKTLIVDGARLQSMRAINNQESADGTVYTQTMNLSGKGVRFGVRLDYCPLSTLNGIISAIKTAVDSGGTFAVVLQDDFHNINVSCVPDGDNWLSYPEQRISSYIKGVVMRLVTA